MPSASQTHVEQPLLTRHRHDVQRGHRKKASATQCAALGKRERICWASERRGPWGRRGGFLPGEASRNPSTPTARAMRVSEQPWGDPAGRASWHLSVLDSDTGRGQAAQQTPPGLVSRRADAHTPAEAQGFPLAPVHPVAGHTGILPRGTVAPAQSPDLSPRAGFPGVAPQGALRGSPTKPWL